jgi:hypothetical protein
MNKIAKTLCMIAVVALAFTSCKKEENQSKSFAFKGVTEQFIEVNQDGEFERMYIDDEYNTYFNVGDKFMMFCIYDAPNLALSHSARYELTEHGIMEPVDGAVVVADVMQEGYSGNYYSFYPGEAVTGFASSTTRTQFQLPSIQTYRASIDGAVQMPEKAVFMAAKDLDHRVLAQTEFYFKNIMGAMSLRLYSSEGQVVKAIRVHDNRFNLAGTVALNLAATDPVELTYWLRNYDEGDEAYMASLNQYLFPTDGSLGIQPEYSGDLRKTITLDCGEGVELGTTAATATRFLIPLRPLALMNGCEITVVFDDNTTKVFNTTTDHRMIPNVIKNFYPMSVD